MAQMTFYEVAVSALTKLESVLSILPGRSCVYPGEIAWDDCDCDGLLAASYARFFPSENFPAENVSEYVGAGCAPVYNAGELIIQIVRCAPGPDEDGAAPSCEALGSAARLLYDEGVLLRDTLANHLCALESDGLISARHMRDTVFNGPDGMCVGATTRAIIGLDWCPDGNC